MVEDEPDPSEHVPVLAGVAGPERARKGRRWRRAGVAAMTAVIVAACLGWLGPREASASDGGLEVTYPQITRPGLESTVELTVTPVGADTPVLVEMSTVTFDRLGLETISPAPTRETSAGDTVRLEFEPPGAGEELTVRFVGRLATRTTPGASS
jgi:hypothetical protein